MLGCLDIFLISNIQNIGINRLFLLHLSLNFTICPIFICEFIFLLIVIHIPLCNVRQPYKGCPLTCFLAKITRYETVWRMRTNNVKIVYWHKIVGGVADTRCLLLEGVEGRKAEYSIPSLFSKRRRTIKLVSF